MSGARLERNENCYSAVLSDRPHDSAAVLADNIALLAALLMTTSAQVPTIVPRPIRNLRWWIGALLFASTVINYLERQTLSLLAPFLELEYRWNNTDYAFADGIPRSLFHWRNRIRRDHG